MDASRISQSQEYSAFRSCVPMRKVVVDDDADKFWTVYDAGPRNIRCPIIFMPPASGTADIYFSQVMALTSVGYRVLSIEYPVYWTMKEWIMGFRRFLDWYHFDRVHIFGSSLGGYFGQKFAEFSGSGALGQRVASIILCNSFTDTTVFRQTGSAPFFRFMPPLFLKKMVMGSFPRKMMDLEIVDSIDFIVEKLDSLSQSQLASRLTLNCMDSYIEPQKLRGVAITIIDVFDECALSQRVRDESYKCYPDARRAHMKSGGNFPYLSRPQEVNVIIQVHLSQFENTKYSAREPRPDLIQDHESATPSFYPDFNEREQHMLSSLSKRTAASPHRGHFCEEKLSDYSNEEGRLFTEEDPDEEEDEQSDKNTIRPVSPGQLPKQQEPTDSFC